MYRCGMLFFIRAKHILGDFEGFFEGAKTFLTPKLSWPPSLVALRHPIWVLIYSVSFLTVCSPV